MDSCNVLSPLWAKKIKYCLVEEDLLTESTFIQQTSKGGKLWKAQLGMTKNYVIFLRCDHGYLFSLGKDFRVATNNLNLLINMIPVSHLHVKKHSRRTLEILFPSGSICYFKLLICPGCGKAWSRWRTLAQVCDKDILPLVPESRLIPFSSLDSDMQKRLVDQNFVVCFMHLEENYWTVNVDLATKKSFNGECMYSTTGDSGLDSSMSRSTKLSSKSTSETEIVEIIKVPVEERIAQNVHSPFYHRKDSEKPEKKTRKKKPIRRFGEGIPENCVFDLFLSYSDEILIDMCREKIETDLESGSKHILQKRTSNIFKESKRNDSEVNQRKMTVEVKKKRNEKHTKKTENADYMHVDNIFKATQFFTNISLLVIPDGLRRSKSVDSISEISPEKYSSSYLSNNLSLPDLHELILYRRYNRLSYSVDYFADAPNAALNKGHSTHEISFWLPDKKSDGRIYCTHPICRKNSAHKRKRTLARWDEPKALRKSHAYAKCARQVKHDKRKDGNFSSKPKGTDESFEILCKESYATGPFLGQTQPSDEIRKASKSSSLDKNVSRFDQSGDCLNAGNKGDPLGSIETRLFEPYEVAYELHRIQQRMFCEIETPEIVRFILKPHTVTEVNCPYLSGYLFLFERLKNLVSAEISAQTGLENAVRMHRLFVQVAIACFKNKDEQSAFAITAGLCNPLIPHYGRLWSRILSEKEDAKYLTLLFRHCWNRKKWQGTKQYIPFFLDFITLLVECLMKEIQNSSLIAPEKESIWDIFTKNSHRRNFNSRNKRIFAELRILSEGNLENIIKIIEECRKYYIYNEVLNSSATDINIKDYLLLQYYN